MMEKPLAVLAELTHRCPLQCPYCSNPVELERAGTELDTATWLRVVSEIADIGALQVHFSGGEPMARPDLEEIVAGARDVGLYTNLITSAALLSERRLAGLVEAGLDHVQISFQDSEGERADLIAGNRGAHGKKLAAAAAVRAAGLPLTVNLVVHRLNIDGLDDLLRMALALEPQRIEVAHVQYHGWALRNRSLLMPTRRQVDSALATVEQVRGCVEGSVVIDHVLPDYHARRPKACMGGWGQRFMNITPSGRVLPCHAAESIPGLSFENVRENSLARIWDASEAFRAFRGTQWMREPCRSCEFREVDWGGCRCQAFSITGEARNTDPACDLSDLHEQFAAIAGESPAAEPSMEYRSYANSRKALSSREPG